MLLIMLPFALWLNSNIEGATYMYLKNTDIFEMISFLPEGVLATILLFSSVIWMLFGLVWGIYCLATRKTSARIQTGK